MQQLVRSTVLAFSRLSSAHRVLWLLLAVLTVIIAGRPDFDRSDNIFGSRSLNFDSQAPEISLPSASEPFDYIGVGHEEQLPKDEFYDAISTESNVHEYTVSSGDTLSRILSQYGVDMNDISLLTKADRDLRSLSIGQFFSWTFSGDGRLDRLSWEVSPRETRVYQRGAEGFTLSRQVLNGEWNKTLLSGSVNGSFVSSAQKVGLTAKEIAEVIKALQWQLDFRKLRVDDKFAVLLSRETLKDKDGHSKLLGVRLQTGGKDYYAIRSEDGKFYDRTASGLEHGFMRFPTVKQYRVSSPFNPHRRNPVTGLVAPHKGVDFSMPQGTPVLATGDGEIVSAAYSNTSGNYIAIRHGRQYMTRYMHLKKLLVKPGDKVKRGARIALSGNTGRSTGPHLHYEVWINNQAVNPLTAKLPRSGALTGKDRNLFLQQVKTVAAQLTF